jgi:hypothetical protein
MHGGASAEGEEEIEDHVEMQQHSRSNVAMLAARGTFIAGTAAVPVTVTEARYSTKLVQQAHDLPARSA